jgi:hypothetical protein
MSLEGALKHQYYHYAVEGAKSGREKIMSYEEWLQKEDFSFHFCAHKSWHKDFGHLPDYHVHEGIDNGN